ncbi:glycerophosphodiester phosphodiesterase family protein [Niallia circulans]
MTKIFAHRGFSAHYPENTMMAFIEAEKAEADGIEIDIQMSKDGEIVIIHDEKVDRTTNASGYVQAFNYKELRSFNAGHRFKQVENEPIPTLIELFDWMQDNDIICNIEMKNNKIAYEGMEEKTIALIRKYGFEKELFSPPLIIIVSYILIASLQKLKRPLYCLMEFISLGFMPML